jgi:hypothetical protein
MSGTHLPISYDTAGQPRTYRVRRPGSRDAAHRRLAITILGLDVQTLASDLRARRLGAGTRPQPQTSLRPAA